MKVKMYARTRRGICHCREIELDENDDDVSSDGITSSVGEQGVNASDDVRTIQQLLNSISINHGGPQKLLNVDGQCGPATKAAILRFQRYNYNTIKVADSLVEPNRNTWNCLGRYEGTRSGGQARTAAALASAPAAGAISDDTQQLFVTYLYLARWRVFDALTALNAVQGELDVLNMRTFLLPKVNFMGAVAEKLNGSPSAIEETIQANRCFKFFEKPGGSFDMKLTYGQVSAVVTKLKAVFKAMLDVIIANSITTPEDEKTGKRRFLRVVRQPILHRAHPEYGPTGVLADATLGGWNSKDARLARIRYGDAHVNQTNAFSTLIHEMAHFVSHPHTYSIGDHGYYHRAFTVTPYLAVRNAESYSWFALLASHKYLRSLPDNALPTNL